MAWEAFLTILAIIGIVVIAGGIIAFLIHMVLGAFDSEKRVARKVDSKKEVLDYNQYKQLENTKENDYDFEAINQAKAEEEKKLAEKDAEEETEHDFDLVEDNDDDLEEIENRLKESNSTEQTAEKEDDEDLDLDSLMDEINDDVVEEEKDRINEENQVKMDDSLKALTIDEYLNKKDEENEESSEEETESNEEAENVEETSEETETNEETETSEETNENEEVKTEEVEEESAVEEPKKDENDIIIADLRAQIEELNKQLEQAKTTPVVETTIDMTKEECLERLEILKERLKNTQKEYKANLREYKPLKRAMRDLERNEAKLRRKEALVIKKKFDVYGVKNYVDIDEQEAKELANELELLDGLRLSVSHCEEVINANKDRYPILEHTNNLLEEQIANIEADIEYTNKILAKINEGDSDNGSNGSESDDNQTPAGTNE